MRIAPSISENDAHMPAIWRILATLLGDTSVCQADLRSRTGLSHPVVVQQVAQLRRSGLIQFGSPQGGITGRPRIPIAFNWDFRRLLAVEVHPAGVTFQATDLAGRPIGKVETGAIASWTQQRIDEALSSGIRNALQTHGSPWAGIGIVIPAAIDTDRRTVASWPVIPTWQHDPLAERLEQAFALPVFLCNEAEALARAVWAECDGPARSIIAISLRQNLRAVMAMMTGNCADHSMDGPFGAIGHIEVCDSEARCAECGTTCLNAALQAARSDAALRPQVIESLAKIMADMVTVFNPGCLVLQVDVDWIPAETETVREILQARAFYGTGRELVYQPFPYQARENLIGVASAMAGQLLDLRTGRLNEWMTA